MAGITQRLLHLRPILRPLPYPLHHFSSSSDPEPPSDIAEPESNSETQSKPSFSLYFNDVKATLQREPPPQNRPQTLRKPLSFSNPSPSQTPPPKTASLEEIRRNLSEFRNRSAPPPPSSSSGEYVSLQELYKRNVISNAEESAPSSDSPAVKRPAGLSFDTIRESLRQLRANSPAKNQNDSRGKPIDPMSLARFRESLNLKPDQNADLDSPMIIGGSDGLPPSIFGKEKKGSDYGNVGSSPSMRMEFLKSYNYPDLGEKLKMLRPEKKKGKWFSLHELSERLSKLREIEEKESQVRTGGISFKDLRETLETLTLSDDEKKRKKIGKFVFFWLIFFQ